MTLTIEFTPPTFAPEASLPEDVDVQSIRIDEVPVKLDAQDYRVFKSAIHTLLNKRQRQLAEAEA